MDSLELVPAREGGVRIRVHARPRSKGWRAGIHSVQEGALVVRLAAAPVDGAANAELVATLADVLGIARRDVVLLRGGASRAKVIEIRGLPDHEVRARLGAAMR